MDRRYATLLELKTRLTRLDVLDANEWLDAHDEAVADWRRRNEPKRK